MGKPRIIFCNRFFFPDHSATAQMLSHLAFHLAEVGHRVVVVTSSGLYDDSSSKLPISETINGVEIHRVYGSRFGRASLIGRAVDYVFMYFAFAQAVLRLADANDIVIAKTDPPLLSAALFPAARWKRAKVANWLQDLYPEVAIEFGMNTISFFSPILKALRDMSLRGADVNIVIGDGMQKRLRDIGVAADRISVIPNWADGAKIKPLESADNYFRRAWALQEKFIVAYSGNLGRAHEYQTILDAAEDLKDQPDLMFLFIGGGALIPQLKRDVQERGLQSRFCFQPYLPVDALAFSLSLPDVCWVSLLPSMEGLIVPSKFYGSCAAGRPTIFVGHPNGELARVIRKHDCGIVVGVGNSEELALGIREMRRVPQRLKEMGFNARKAFEQDFSFVIAFESWEEVLKKMQLEKSQDCQ